LIKGASYQEDITIVVIYAPNTGMPNFIKQTLLDIKIHIDPNTIIVDGLTTTLSSIDRLCRKKTKRESSELNDTTDQMDLTDMY
jgi:hypothetical protein